MVGGDDEVGGVAGARSGPEIDRFGRRLVGGFAPVVQRLGVEVQLLGDREPVLGEGAHPLGRRHQQVERGVVERVASEVEALEAIGTRDTRIAVRQVRRVDGIGLSRLHRQVVTVAIGIGERIAPAEDARAAALDRDRRDVTVGRTHFLLLGVAQAEEQVAAFVVETPGDVRTGDFAIALVELAVVQRDLAAIEVATRDDVDHAGDRIGTVQRGCAVLQHLDPFDQRERNGIEIHRGADAGGGRLVDPTHAIDQHQHALRPEVAQVHLRGARADAVAVRREAEVARRIELGIECGAGAGQLLQDVADGRQAGALDLLARQRLDRHAPFHLSTLDAAAGHGERVERGGFLRHGAGGQGKEHGNAYGRSQGVAARFHDSLSPKGVMPHGERLKRPFVVKNR